MAYIPGSDPFKTLSNAFGGTAKGAFDYTQVRLKQNQIDESKRQHDQNLRLGFKRLDEQIRQFDVGTKEHRELTEARMKLDATLRREGFVSAEKRTKMQKEAPLGAASIRAKQQEKDRQYRRDLAQRNFSTQGLLNGIEHVAGDLWKDYNAWNAGEGTGTETFPWEARANVAARQLAESKAMGEPVTEDDIALARRQIDSYDKIKSTYVKDTLDLARAKRGQQMIDDDAWGLGGYDELPQQAWRSSGGEGVDAGSTHVDYGRSWPELLKARYSAGEGGARKRKGIDKLKAATDGHARAVIENITSGPASIETMKRNYELVLKDLDDYGFSTEEIKEITKYSQGEMDYYGVGPGHPVLGGSYTRLVKPEDQAEQVPTEAQAVGIAARAMEEGTVAGRALERLSPKVDAVEQEIAQASAEGRQPVMTREVRVAEIDREMQEIVDRGAADPTARSTYTYGKQNPPMSDSDRIRWNELKNERSLIQSEYHREASQALIQEMDLPDFENLGAD